MSGGFKPLDGTFALSKNWEFFQARWQTNGVIFRRLSGPEDVTNYIVATQLVSWSGHQHALVEPPSLLTTWDDRDPSVPRTPISFLYTSHSELEPLRQVLNLGIMFAEVGTIRWQGSCFRTECIVEGEHVVITGELFPRREGRPRAVKVRYAFPDRAYDYLIRYGYPLGLNRGSLPDVITNFWLRTDPNGAQRAIELNQWRILALETTDDPLVPGAFDPASFALCNRWNAHVYTNGGFYERETNGTLRLAYMLPAPGKAPISSSPGARRSFYTCWCGLNLAIFALMLGAKETKPEQTSTRRKDDQS